MATTVSASEVRQRFRRMHEAAMKEPVEIQIHGRTTAYLVSADTFTEMWKCYRRSFPVGDLTDEEMQEISAARVPGDVDWDAGARPEGGASRHTSR